MDTFFENAERIFDVARSDSSGEPNEFTLLIRPDGGMHIVMDSEVPVDGGLVDGDRSEVATVYRVTKTAGGGVQVSGRSGDRECMLRREAVRQDARISGSRFVAELLRDQPLYRISSPLALSASS